MNFVVKSKMYINAIKKYGFTRVFLEGIDRMHSKKKRKDSRAICIRYFRKRYSSLLLVPDAISNLDSEWLVKCSEDKGIDMNRVPVFIFWYQGFDKAPDVVRMCRNQLERMIDKQRFQIISVYKDNMDAFVSLPGYIKQKVIVGSIDLAQLADIVRASLLYNHGGIWCDATYFLTGDIPKYITERNMFIFKNSTIDRDGEKGSNAFMYSTPYNEIFGKVLLQFQEYWKSHNKLCLYTLFHIFFALAVDSSFKSKKEFADIPTRDPRLNEICAHSFYNSFNLEEWDYIQKLTFAHKLTYKLNYDKINDNSLYKYIIDHYK